LPTVRASGRKDYHMLYVQNGEIIVKERRVKSGELYIFYPDTPQCYTYLPAEHSLYYWCHFTGSSADKLIKENRLSDGLTPANGRKHEIDALLSLITDSLKHGEELNSQYIHLLFYALITLFSAPAEAAYPYKRAVELLEDLSAETGIDEIAAIYKVSVPHFIRRFKETYGTTPLQYRINCQLTQAKNLLVDTALPLSVIAEECGFSDPFYFSRLFKRHVGVSPSRYREAEPSK